jgi:glycerophosphoryl diester phosphodiesterase
MQPVTRIGHGGASAVVRGNTLESFDAARDIGVDMIEFDVRSHRGSPLVAHTRVHASLLSCPTLDRALLHLAGRSFDGIALNPDLKDAGCVDATLYALARFGLRERALVSSQCVEVVDRVRRVDPGVATAISIGGRVSRAVQRWGEWRRRALDALGARRFDALMVHHRLIDRRLVDEARERDGDLYAWTVDDRGLIASLTEMGVRGITTNDPRLFAPAA